MLILFGPNFEQIPIKSDVLKRCKLADFVAAYVERRMADDLREEFEQHLLDCEPCQRAVHLGRIRTRSNPHNTTDGSCCAVKIRRKP